MEIKRFGAFLNEMKKAYGEDFSLRDIKAGDKVRAIGNCRFNLKRFPNDPYAKSKLKELTK